jgi:pimeloyl-ACP methyl ester carboxylesterase
LAVYWRSDMTDPATLPGLTHHRLDVNGTRLHYVSAGTDGSPILLVHGFPESWWAFHKLIPLLAATHRVFAVDLRGFGDSDNAAGPYDSATLAEDLHHLIAHLDVGPVHLTGQDVSGAAVFRLSTTHPENVRSLTAIETGLPGLAGSDWPTSLTAAPGTSAFSPPPASRRCCSPTANMPSSASTRSPP